MIKYKLFATVLPLLAAGCRETPAAEGGATSSRSRAAARPVVLDDARLDAVYTRAGDLRPLRSLLVFHRDSLRRERYFSGARANQPANIKSASKSVISALVGMALERGHLRDVRQPLSGSPPTETRSLDSTRRAIAVEDLLTMRAGLQSTSFDQYGAFVTSRNWVQHALTRPVVASRGEGAPMIYSTGSTHLLSAVLTRATKQSTHAFARRSLAPLGIRLLPWTTDPQGVFFGGNEMRMTPREMLAFGRLYLDGGRAPDGTQLLARAWIDSPGCRAPPPTGAATPTATDGGSARLTGIACTSPGATAGSSFSSSRQRRWSSSRHRIHHPCGERGSIWTLCTAWWTSLLAPTGALP